MDQYHETTIVDSKTDLSTNVISIPSRSYSDSTEEAVDTLLGNEFDVISDLRSGRLLLPLALVLSGADDYDSYEVASHEDWYQESIDVEQEFIDFAESLAYAPIIPFEASPLEGEALGTIVGSFGVGATVGFIVAGPSPLLFITVPAGIIICEAARGAGSGLRQRLYDLLSGGSSEDDPEEPAGNTAYAGSS